MAPFECLKKTKGFDFEKALKKIDSVFECSPAEIDYNFVNFIKKIGPYFYEYDSLFNEKEKNVDSIIEYSIKHLHYSIENLKAYIPEIWSSIRYIYLEYKKHIAPYWNEDSDDMKKIRANIKNGIREARPLIRLLFNYNIENQDRCGIDPLVLLCELLYIYIADFEMENIDWDRKKSIYIKRNYNDGHKNYNDDNNRGWNKCQIEKGESSYVCVIPAKRKMRIKSHIFMIKTLWDVSSNFKGKNFYEMLKNAKIF